MFKGKPIHREMGKRNNVIYLWTFEVTFLGRALAHYNV